MLLLAALSLAAWVFLLLGRSAYWQDGERLAAAAPGDTPVTVVVPARDEAAGIERCVRSLLAQDYAALSVVVVDDGSTDGTAQLAAAVGRDLGDSRLTVVEAGERPPGWSGKLWALSQGVALARDDLLLFTDADIVHQPGHVSALVAKAGRDRLDLVSEMVALSCETRAERALVPAFVYFFQLLYPFAEVNDPQARTAAAAGGTVLIRAEALARIGGLAAMRDALIDDVTLAARIKKSGRIWLGHSRQAASIRPYPHPRDIWAMISRTAYTQLGYSPLLLAGTVLGLALIFLMPPFAALFGHGRACLAGVLAWMAMAASYLPTLRRFGLSPAYAPFLPAIAAFYMAATLASAANYHAGAGVSWKQRNYG